MITSKFGVGTLNFEEIKNEKDRYKDRSGFVNCREWVVRNKTFLN